MGVWAKSAALLMFLAASLTDYYDGKIARRTGQITNFGKLMDPIADKILMIAAFLAFVEQDLIPAWMVVVVIMRELFITGVRLVAVGRGVVLAAETGGKHKTVSQIAAIFLTLIFLLAKEAAVNVWNPTFELWFKRLIFYMMLVVVCLTLTSAISFLKRNEKLLK
jgi:CDP-diacylglycerol--glycerol-3-phosphate 3-phosphatidyltransferase